MWWFLTSFWLQNSTSIPDDLESISSGLLCCAPASSAFMSIGYIKTCCINVIIHLFLFLSSLHHPFHQTLLPCNIPSPHFPRSRSVPAVLLLSSPPCLLWLEMAECAVAPVAMEDSDHEVDSASDEQDSVPASPEPRMHEVEKVLVHLPPFLPLYWVNLTSDLLGYCPTGCP